MKKTIKASCIFFLNAGVLFAGLVEQLAPGEWLAVSSSHLRSVEKKAHEYPDWNGSASAMYYSINQGNGGFAGIINKWSGGVFDPVHNRMLIWGGGHWGYGGNEIYSFEVDSLKWTRVTDPTVPAAQCSLEAAPGFPAARHTYGGIEYLAHSNRLFGEGGSEWCRIGGCGNEAVWTFDFSSGAWEKRTPTGAALAGGCEMKSVYWPEDSSLFYHTPKTGSRALYRYRESKNTYENLTPIGGAGAGQCYSKSMVIDSKRRLLVEVGNSTTMSIDVCSLDSLSKGFSTVLTTGETGLTHVANPGLAYDPVSDKIVAWYYGPEVYLLDMDTRVWTRREAALTNTIRLPGQCINEGGVYGRFRYMPKYNAFIAVIHVDSPVFIYKLTEGLGTDTERNRHVGGVWLDPIRVSPNPVSRTAQISLNGPRSAFPVTLRLYDGSGRILRQWDVSGNGRVEFKAGELAPGIYFLRTRIGNQFIEKRLSFIP